MKERMNEKRNQDCLVLGPSFSVELIFLKNLPCQFFLFNVIYI